MSEVYQFSVEHAAQYGVTESIILRNLILNIRNNRNNGRNCVEAKDGTIRWWTYNKYDAFVATFPFWTRDQIRYGINSLLKQNVIYIEKHAQDKSDQRNWFALKDESMLDLFSGAKPKARVGDLPPAPETDPEADGDSAYQGGDFTDEAGTITEENEGKGGTFTKQGGNSAHQGPPAAVPGGEGGKIPSQGGKIPNSYKVLEESNETPKRNQESREDSPLRGRGDSATPPAVRNPVTANTPPDPVPARVYTTVNIAESNNAGEIFKAIIDDPDAGRCLTLSKQSYANLQRWFKACGRQKFIAGCQGFLADPSARQKNYPVGFFEKDGPDRYIKPIPAAAKVYTNDDYDDNLPPGYAEEWYKKHPEMYAAYPEYAPAGYEPGGEA